MSLPTTGATPGAGATPAQAGATEPTTPPAPGATPPAGTPPAKGATPPAGTTDTTPTAPATGEDALGDTGKGVLREARRLQKEAEDRAKAAEEERDALKTATQSESEKATAAAVKEAEGRVRTDFEARIRSAEVRRALTAAGVSESEIGLAAMAPEFAKLKLSDVGEVEKLSETVEAFKTAHPGLFGAPAGNGSGPDYGGGNRGRLTLTLDEIKKMTPEEVANRLPEINQALARS